MEQQRIQMPRKQLANSHQQAHHNEVKASQDRLFDKHFHNKECTSHISVPISRYI